VTWASVDKGNTAAAIARIADDKYLKAIDHPAARLPGLLRWFKLDGERCSIYPCLDISRTGLPETKYRGLGYPIWSSHGRYARDAKVMYEWANNTLGT
jgi:hypothetical protein